VTRHSTPAEHDPAITMPIDIPTLMREQDLDAGAPSRSR
jgi:hypothetical protein